MDGPFIARKILLGYSPLANSFPASSAANRVTAGSLPTNALLPALGITEVVATDRHTLGANRATKTKVTSRVQITAMAKTYPETKALLRLARLALRNFVGNVDGVSGPVTAILAEVGPDFEHDAGFVMQSQDVRITFDDAE